MVRQHPGADPSVACIWPATSGLNTPVATRLLCWANGFGPVVSVSQPSFHYEVPKALCGVAGPLIFFTGGPDECPLGDDLTVSTATVIDPNTCATPPTGVVTSVNAQTGAVVLGASDVGAAALVHTHPQSEVIGLTTALAAKADTSALPAAATTVAGETTYGASSAVGAATTYAREDHTHGTPALASSTPTALTIGGTGVVGVAATPARADHVHPMPAFGGIPPVASGVGSTGVATTVSRSDHWHPVNGISPGDYSAIAWTFAPNSAGASAVLGAAGTVQVCKIPVPVATTVTNVILGIGTGGVTLTGSQCLAALYSGAGALLSTTADQSASWLSSGAKIMALGAPQGVSAGYVYVAWFYNGLTSPATTTLATRTPL